MSKSDKFALLPLLFLFGCSCDYIANTSVSELTLIASYRSEEFASESFALGRTNSSSKTLPKILTRGLGNSPPSFYFKDTGKIFYPEGNVLQQTDEKRTQFQFNEMIYDHDSAEDALLRMRNAGYNVVRVWLDCTSRADNYGIAGPGYRNQIELYPAYMDNFFDFLSLATEYDIYVIVANLFFPVNRYYRDISLQCVYNDSCITFMDCTSRSECNGDPLGFDRGRDQTNLYFYTKGGVEATATYLGQLASEVKDFDGGRLVNTILAFEVWNEIHSRSDQYPFNYNEDGTYNDFTMPDEFWPDRDDLPNPFKMNRPDHRQLCHDVVLGWFLRECASAIRERIPDALVSTSVFTNKAVLHNSFNGGLPTVNCDPMYLCNRWPGRILWLTDNPAISYIDIHLYPTGDAYDLEEDLASLEWSIIDKTKKPFFAGEIGAIRGIYPDLPSALVILEYLRNGLYEMGFSGNTFYTWNNVWNKTPAELALFTDKHWSIELENPTSSGEYYYPIAGVLAPAARWKLFEFNDDSIEGWMPVNMSSVSVANGQLTATLDANNASLLSPQDLAIDSKYVRKVRISIKNESNANGIDLYWITDSDQVWNELKVKRTSLEYSDEFVLKEFDLWDHPEWKGKVKQLYIVPARLWGGGSLSGRTAIDFIRVL